MTTLRVNSDGSGDYLTPLMAVYDTCQKVIAGDLPVFGVYDIVCENCIDLVTANNTAFDTLNMAEPPEGFYVERDGGYDIDFRPLTDVVDPDPIPPIAINFNIMGASDLFARSVIWMHNRGLRFYGLVNGAAEINICFKDMVFYSREGAPLITSEDGVHTYVKECATAGQGTIAQVGNAIINLDSLHQFREQGTAWHVYLQGKRDYGLFSGDYTTPCLVMRRARVGIVKTGKIVDIQNCFAPDEGIDQYEEIGPYDFDLAWRGWRMTGNIIDRVRFHGNCFHRACSLTLRHGGLYRRLYVPNPAGPIDRPQNLGEDFTAMGPAIRICSAGFHYFVIEKCVVVGWYIGVQVDYDQMHNGAFIGMVHIRENYFKFVDHGIRNVAIAQQNDSIGRPSRLEAHNNRWFPGGFGHVCEGVTMFTSKTFTPVIEPEFSCNNGPIRFGNDNCSPGGVQSPGPSKPPVGDTECPGDESGAPQQCDMGLHVVAVVQEKNTTLDLSSLQQEGLNNPGCVGWSMIQWGGGAGGGSNIHTYFSGRVLPDGTLDGMPEYLLVSTVYSGNIFLQFTACESPSGGYPTGTSGAVAGGVYYPFQVFPPDYELDPNSPPLLPPEAIIQPPPTP